MKLEENVLLQKFTTFRVGGPAKVFVIVRSFAELLEAATYAKDNKLPIFVLGGGSNILVSDQGFSGMVIKLATTGIKYETTNTGKKILVNVAAGENWDDFVLDTTNRGLFGLENLSGIPGSVGAAPIQNIGAYGSELKDVLVSVEVFDMKTLKTEHLSNKECLFGYRDSIFKRKENSDLVVVSITLELKKNGQTNISYRDLAKFFSKNPKGQLPSNAEVREAVLSIRKEKLPDLKKYGTAGSFFKNPILPKEKFAKLSERFPGLPSYAVDGDKIGQKDLVKISAAWLIDKVCHLKDFRRGSVGTYPNQALVLINYGGATASEIFAFGRTIEVCVKEKTGIDLEWEVGKVGHFL